jgi:hypothetical protein
MASNGHANGENGYLNGGMNGDVRTTPRQKSKLGTIGADGFPVLPPIRKPVKRKEDPYSKSKLMTYRLASENKQLLMKIL